MDAAKWRSDIASARGTTVPKQRSGVWKVAGLCLAVILLVGPVGRVADLPLDQEPGARVHIDPRSLPPPNATANPVNPATAVPQPHPPPFRLPSGFSVNAFAAGLGNPRWMTVAPNGDVFLAEPDLGQVTLLRDADGDGRAEMILPFADGFRRPHGLAVRGDQLYVTDVDAVWRLPWRPGMTRAEGQRQRVTSPGALGAAGVHWTRDIAFSRDGGRIYVAIGSNENIGEDPPPHATVQSFAVDGSDQRTLAAGLRNPVGIALYPGTDDVYVTVNERDRMGDWLVPDFLTRLQPDGFYGWPYAYIGPHAQPGMPERHELVDRTIVPDLLFESHSAPLGLVFYDTDQFPETYRGGAFVALHGSWNRAQPTGYKVVWVPFKDARPVGYYETFLSGFWLGGSPAQVWGRPAGLAIAGDGSLLIADDVSNTVWRVSYRR
jgi:glucose/arabinose dehydrogenase